MKTSEKFIKFVEMYGQKFISMDTYNDILKEIEELEAKNEPEKTIVVRHGVLHCSKCDCVVDGVDDFCSKCGIKITN